MNTTPERDPSDVSDVELNWAGVLGSATLSSVTSVTIAPSGELAENAGARSTTDTTSTHFFSGGVAGSDYLVTVKIAASGSRVFERSILIPVRDK